jgi:hypothetical protein
VSVSVMLRLAPLQQSALEQRLVRVSALVLALVSGSSPVRRSN